MAKNKVSIDQSQYPHLFNEVTWPWGPTRAKFILLDELPPDSLIGNVNILPQIGDSWLILRHQNGAWDIPGGTLEIGETYLETLQRELLEEVGGKLHSFSIFGAWHCYSLASEPYRPHLPFPEYYRLVGTGKVEIIQSPTNPPDAEQIAEVKRVSLPEATTLFGACGRFDLAELYRLASRIIAQIKINGTKV